MWAIVRVVPGPVEPHRALQVFGTAERHPGRSPSSAVEDEAWAQHAAQKFGRAGHLAAWNPM